MRRSSQLFLSHVHLVLVCVMRPKNCLAIRDQFKLYGCRYRRVYERSLEILLRVVRDICSDFAFSGCHGALGHLGAGCL